MRPKATDGRSVAPEQIATLVRFVCSDDVASINGAAIPVYGHA
jgi:NAD(P)-dependent dehydrogenase (short-subunit alcohol dehydrogenase family)